MTSYRHLSAAAHNMLHAMASGLAHDGAGYFAEHLGWAAAQFEVPRIELNLVAGTVSPSEAATAALVRYALWGRDWWRQTVSDVGADPSTVREFFIRGTFDLARRHPAGDLLAGEAAYVTELSATVIDDRGVPHVGVPGRSQLYLAPE
jgi:hypothetical protein